MPKPSIRIRFVGRVAADIRAEIRRIARGFRQLTEVRHPILIAVAPHPCLSTGDGIGFGVCVTPPTRSMPVRIGIAAGLARLVQKDSTRAEGVRAVGHTLLHELVHYTQYRDRQPLAERGVNVRATGLYRRIDEAG